MNNKESLEVQIKDIESKLEQISNSIVFYDLSQLSRLLNEVKKYNQNANRLVLLMSLNADDLKHDLDEVHGNMVKSNRQLMYERCNQYSGSVICVKTNFGKLIGGYLPIKIDECHGLQLDSTTFIFYSDEQSFYFLNQQK